MSVTINILFAGLIAFVPNSSGDPFFVTAYLLEEPHHIQKLTIYGDVCLSNENGVCLEEASALARCHESQRIQELDRAVIECSLGDSTDIVIEPEPEQRRNFLRADPRKEAPENLDEQSYRDWLLRMVNVERVAGHVHSFENIEQRVGARMKFGWSELRTCALDGSEADKVKIFRFGNGSHRQAVAEQVMFTANVRPGPIVIVLRDRIGSKEEFIRADCSRNDCLALKVQNSLVASMPDHFKEYYNLVRNPSDRRMPVEVGYVTIPEGSPSLVDCGLSLAKPVAPKLVGELREVFESQVANQTFDNWLSFIGELFPNLPAPSPSLQDAPRIKAGAMVHSSSLTLRERAALEIRDIINGPLQLQDRIVCPPVIMEP